MSKRCHVLARRRYWLDASWGFCDTKAEKAAAQRRRKLQHKGGGSRPGVEPFSCRLRRKRQVDAFSTTTLSGCSRAMCISRICSDPLAVHTAQEPPGGKGLLRHHRVAATPKNLKQVCYNFLSLHRRNRQVDAFYDIIEWLQPGYVLMENVLDILGKVQHLPYLSGSNRFISVT